MDNTNDNTKPDSARDTVSKISSILHAISQILWPLLAMFVVIMLADPVLNAMQTGNFKIKVLSLELTVDEVREQESELVDVLMQELKVVSKKLQTVSPHQQSTKNPFQNLKVRSLLWVEDTPENSALIISQMEKRKINIRIARSTEQAMSELQSKTFDLVITDMGRLEKGDFFKNPTAGLELLRQIDQLDKPVPVLVYTSRQGQVRDEVLKLGAHSVSTRANVLRAVGLLPRENLVLD